MSSLKAMQYFASVAELGSFSKAAVALRLTQPAISRQVRKLEDEIGVQLLYRKGRSVAPTEAGKLLMLRARELEKEAGRVIEDVRASADQPSGPLSVAVATVIGALLLPMALPAFISRYPDVHLHVLEGYSGLIEEWLLDGRADLALMWGRPRSAAIDITPLLAVRLSLVVPDHATYAARNIIGTSSCTLQQALSLPLILPARSNALRRVAEDSAERLGMPLQVVLEVDSLPLATELVRAGIGCTLMIKTGRADIQEPGVRYIPIVEPEITWVLSYALLKGTRISPAILEFVDAVACACGQLVDSAQLTGHLLQPQVAAGCG